MKIIIETEKLEYDDHYYLIVPDSSAGVANVYSVYCIGSHPIRHGYDMPLIGNELPLEQAKELVRKLEKSWTK